MSSGAAGAAGLLADLPPLRVQGRLDRLRERLAIVGDGHSDGGGDSDGVDAAVITVPANVRWLTGFTGSNGTVVIRAGEALLITDARYGEQAPEQLAAGGCDHDVEVVVASRTAGAAAPHLEGIERIGLEDSIAWGEQLRWRAAVDAETVPLNGVVEDLRAVKDRAEVARIEAAARIADEALASVEPMLRAGESETRIALALDDAMRAAGASGPAYDTIVASGPNSALPHARPTERRLQNGDLLIIDVGAVVDGYRSDMTRTFTVGAADEWSSRVRQVVTEAQAAGAAAVRPGVAAATVDAACREVIAAAGMGEAFVHGTGHGVGLDIHELPRVAARSEAVLEPGNVLTVEPGVYFAGTGGARVEDLLVVTGTGSRPLTLHPKASQHTAAR